MDNMNEAGMGKKGLTKKEKRMWNGRGRHT